MTDGLQIVHPVPAEEIPGWHASVAATFLNDPRADEATDWRAFLERSWDPDRVWGARDRGRWVAGLRTLPRTVTVPDGDGGGVPLAADALTAVTVAPSHRRRGLLTQMLDDSLAAARDRGDPLSILIAAEWGIYGRFGYAPAALTASRTLHRGLPGSRIEGDLTRVRHVEPDKWLSIAPAVFDLARRGRAGQVDRDPPWWPAHHASDGYPAVRPLPHNYVVREGDDGPDGVLAWSTTREGGMLPPRGAVVVNEGPFAVTDEAHRDLWAYLSGIDGVDEVTVRTALDDPVSWLLPDARTLRTGDIHDDLWLRLLDVPAALAARRYATAEELVLEVTDPTPVSVAGRYRLCAHGDEVTCEPTTAPAQITVSQTALAAAYLGGFSMRAQRIAGGVSEHHAGALQRADAMFQTPLAPLAWTHF